MTEFTAILPLKIEVTINAKSKDEALSFSMIYMPISPSKTTGNER